MTRWLLSNNPFRNRLIKAHIIIPPRLRSGYQEFYADHHLQTLRWVMVGALVIYALFGLLDLYLLDHDALLSERKAILVIRFGFGLPLLLAQCSFAYTRFFSQHHQLITSTFILTLLSLLWVMMLKLSDPAIQHIYFSGLMISLLAGLIVSRIQFLSAVLSCLFFGVLLFVGYNWLTDLPTKTVVIQSFFYVTVTVLGLLACLSNEMHIRNYYFRMRDIKAEQRRLEKDNSSLYHIAQFDGLTGLANRRHFESAYAKEWRRAERGRTPISICMIDVDHFKAYNDHYGHQEGDQCLIKLGALLNEIGQRPGDLAARYGGEEFVLLLPGAGLDSARRIGQKVCDAVVKLAITHDYSPIKPVVTVSVGVASENPVPGPVDVEALQETLIRQADQALYAAKHQGKNCVMALLENNQRSATPIFESGIGKNQHDSSSATAFDNDAVGDTEGQSRSGSHALAREYPGEDEQNEQDNNKKPDRRQLKSVSEDDSC